MSYAEVKAERQKALKEVARRNKTFTHAESKLNESIQEAIKAGVAFTDLGMVMGLSEAAIRQRSNRRGWHEAGTRRSR